MHALSIQSQERGHGENNVLIENEGAWFNYCDFSASIGNNSKTTKVYKHLNFHVFGLFTVNQNKQATESTAYECYFETTIQFRNQNREIR